MLFGSQVNGRAHKDSDCDILVIYRLQQALDTVELAQFRDNSEKFVASVNCIQKSRATIRKDFAESISK